MFIFQFSTKIFRKYNRSLIRLDDKFKCIYKIRIASLGQPVGMLEINTSKFFCWEHARQRRKITAFNPL